MKKNITGDKLLELIESGRKQKILSFYKSSHPAKIAEILSGLLPEEAWAVLELADPALRSEIFSYFDNDFQEEFINILSRKDAAAIIAGMPPDDRALMFKKMPEEKKKRLLHALAKAEREDIRRLTSNKEGTAGAVMTSDYATLSPGMTAEKAISHLREVAPDKETIYYCYIVGTHRKLLGFVTLKDLILADPHTRVENIMHSDVITAHIDDDQEEAARKIQKFDLIALPVINDDNALVGIITHDDAIDIITQEHTEDMEKFMAISGKHETDAYMKTPAVVHFKNRVLWVIALAFIGLISGFIIQNFEGLLMQFGILMTFMPMLADTGGNTGSQSATLVIRALALGEISSKDIFRILLKEAVVGLLIGLLLGIIAYSRVIFFNGNSPVPPGVSLTMIGIAVAIALTLQVLTATIIGALLPLTASKFNLDPAVVASPALTTIVDITGLLIFFTTAKIMLRI